MNQKTTPQFLTRTRTLKLFFCLFMIIQASFSFHLNAQTSSNDFGIGTGSLSSGSSTVFLPAPTTSGSTYAIIGGGGGSVNLDNSGLATFGCATELRAVAPTGVAVNKFSPIINYTSSNQAYARFNVLLGSSIGANTVTSGDWSMYFGDGSMYQDASDFTGSQVFTGLKFTFAAAGALTAQYRSGSTWTAFTPGMVQGQNYTIELMMNNSAATINYTYGAAQTIAPNTFDIWVNGTLVGNDFSKATLPALADMNDICFIGQSSVANVANLFMDNLEVTNLIPGVVTRPNIAISAVPVYDASVVPGTTAVILDAFTVSPTAAPAIFNGIAVNTVGTYISTDITNLKVRYSTDAILDVSDATLSTLVSPGVAGVKILTFSSCQSIPSGSTATIFITADIASGAVLGNNINIAALPFNRIKFISGSMVGTDPLLVGGTKTFCASVPSPPTVTGVTTIGCLSATTLTSSAGANTSWFTSPSGGSAIATGATYTTPILSGPTEYYVQEGILASGTVSYSATGAVQTFTVPAGVSSIDIDARGAQGGNESSFTGGLGARMQGTFVVTPGQVLNVVVGSAGFASYNSGSGGGGSGVLSGIIPMIIAGGGGGASASGGENGGIGLTSTTGGNSSGPGGAAGTGGQKGFRSGDCGWAGGGGGFSGDGYGGDGAWDGGPLPGSPGVTGGGRSWLNGGAGGANGGCSFAIPNSGPFGCGGGGCGSHGGGGGGGYSGGGGGQYTDASGAKAGAGAGSYNNGTAQINTSGFQTGAGQIIINYSASNCPSDRTKVLVNISVSPTTSPDTSILACQNAVLTAAPNGFGDTLAWYNAPTGGTLLHVGSPYTTPILSDTTTYYVENRSGYVASGTASFTYIGGLQTFTVPAGVTSLLVDATAGKGGNGTTGTGGNGARVQSTLTVTPGQVLNIFIGGAGGNFNNTGGYNGGANNPGSSYTSNVGGGGGATDIRIGGTALTDRVLVAGGGGAGAYNGCTENGGVGGGTTGGAASIGCGMSAPGGGTPSAGGAGGAYGSGYSAGSAGSLGNGGNGGSGTGGAGGGGGYYGGGGGSWQGGGGGSSYSIGTGTIHTAGFSTGNGTMDFSWNSSTYCATSRSVVRVFVSPILSPIVSNFTRCDSGTVTLSAVPIDPGQTIDWYADSLGGTILTGGVGTTTFTTPSISSTKVYYAEVRSTITGCVAKKRSRVVASVIPTSSSSSSTTICANETISFNGVILSTSGIFKDTLVSYLACDSFVTFNLTVLPTSTGTINQTICAGTTYLFNGVNRSASGAYLDTFSNYVACDSVVTLNLIIRAASVGTINRSICPGDVYLFNAVNLTTAGIYKDTFINSSSCDSVLTLNLTMLSTSTGTITTTIATGSSYPFNGVNLTQAGVYKDTLVNSSGCDSVVTLTLSVGTAIAAIKDSKWEMNIYPNPAMLEATLNYSLPYEVSNIDIVIYDAQGKIVMTDKIHPPKMIGKFPLNLAGFASGVYFVKLSADGYSETRRLIVDRE